METEEALKISDYDNSSLRAIRHPSTRPVARRGIHYWSRYHADPTPEQLQDDGRVDHIPVVKPEEVKEHLMTREQKLAKLIWDHMEYSKPKTVEVVLVPLDTAKPQLSFKSLKAAGKFLGYSASHISHHLSRRVQLAGYYIRRAKEVQHA